MCCSYKVPAKGDGVDYVRTEDEVGILWHETASDGLHV